MNHTTRIVKNNFKSISEGERSVHPPTKNKKVLPYVCFIIFLTIPIVQASDPYQAANNVLNGTTEKFISEVKKISKNLQMSSNTEFRNTDVSLYYEFALYLGEKMEGILRKINLEKEAYYTYKKDKNKNKVYRYYENDIALGSVGLKKAVIELKVFLEEKTKREPWLIKNYKEFSNIDVWEEEEFAHNIIRRLIDKANRIEDVSKNAKEIDEKTLPIDFLFLIENGNADFPSERADESECILNWMKHLRECPPETRDFFVYLICHSIENNDRVFNNNKINVKQLAKSSGYTQKQIRNFINPLLYSTRPAFPRKQSPDFSARFVSAILESYLLIAYDMKEKVRILKLESSHDPNIPQNEEIQGTNGTYNNFESTNEFRRGIYIHCYPLINSNNIFLHEFSHVRLTKLLIK